jgi:predicted transcriptional regulator of viral defense system
MPKDLTARCARQLFTKHGGTLRTSQALRLGIHPRTLYALRGSGEIEQVARGVYRLASAPPLSNPDWAAIMSRLPRAVICLISALAHHGLTTQVPHATDIALSSHSQIPKMDNIPIRVFWFSEPSFSIGVETVNVDRIPVRIYSAEKTIADCFKYRNKIGLDVAVEALRAYREKKKKPNLNAILEFARVNRVQKVIMPYMEALL